MAMRQVCLIMTIAVMTSLSPAISADLPDFKISQDFTGAEQNYPSIAAGLNGRFAVVWNDFRMGNGDIYCRLYDSSGIAAGGEFAINDDNSGEWQMEPALSADWYGNYFAVWKDYRNGSYPFAPDVYYQKLDSQGAVGSSKNISVEWPDSSHQSPAVGATGWGRTIVAWNDLRNLNWDVFTQTLDNNGEFIGNNLKVNDDVGGTPQHEPEVALSPEGWFAVVWYDGRNGNDDIYLQKFDSSGSKVGGNLRVNDDITSTKQKFPAVAIGGNGVIYVVWTDWRNGQYPVDPDIYGQRFDAALNRLGDNFAVNALTGNTTQRDARVAADRMGNACVVWSDSAYGDWNVRGQMIENSGVFHGQNFDVNVDKDKAQLLPDVALDGYYLYFTWVDSREGNFDIYGRILRYNDPTLLTTPAQAEFSISPGALNPDPVEVVLNNAGYGELNYRLSPIQPWITLSRDSGQTPDTIMLDIDAASLSYGLNRGQVRLIDVANDDSTALFPVTVQFESGDTLYIAPASVSAGLPFQTQISLNLANAITEANLEFKYDTSMLAIDSIDVSSSSLGYALSYYRVDSAGYFGLIIDSDTTFGPGNFALGDLIGRADDSANGITLIEASQEASQFYLAGLNSSHYRPVYFPAEIAVAEITDAGDADNNLPRTYALRQNYPNPFNGATNIEFYLPRAGRVILIIYNILGQQVTTLVDGHLPAGEHLIRWDGRGEGGRETASGIYFYKLTLIEYSAVRRMIYLK